MTWLVVTQWNLKEKSEMSSPYNVLQDESWVVREKGSEEIWRLTYCVVGYSHRFAFLNNFHLDVWPRPGNQNPLLFTQELCIPCVSLQCIDLQRRLMLARQLTEDGSSVSGHTGLIRDHSALGYRHEQHFQLAGLSLAHSFKSSSDF